MEEKPYNSKKMKSKTPLGCWIVLALLVLGACYAAKIFMFR